MSDCRNEDDSMTHRRGPAAAEKTLLSPTVVCAWNDACPDGRRAKLKPSLSQRRWMSSRTPLGGRILTDAP